MSIPSAQSLCGPLSADAPCGPDLEYDAAFQALEAAARPRPELEMGDARIEGGGPDWREVKRLALELFDRTRDLRVAVYLAQAAIETDGWHGLAESLGVVYGLVDGMWDTVHPQLDPDDDLDPTMRLNVIVRLCDRESTLNQLREAPIVSARGMGSFSLRDLEVAQGHSSPREGEDAPSLAAVEGAFLAAPVEELESVRGALGEVLDRWASLDGSLTERLGSAQAPNLEPFAETVRRITHALDQQLANRGVGGGAPAGDDGGGDAGGDDAGGGASAGGAPVAARVAPPGVDSPADVVRALDLIIDYYARREPSSPVPILCERAKGLVNKGFVDILRNLIPDAVHTAEQYVGPTEE
jgi:type VI secretion system protein ImpA